LSAQLPGTAAKAHAGLFLTGTDTGVGKTHVTAALVRLLRGQGRPVRVCKPVASGASWVAGRWLSEDTIRLADAAGAAWVEVTRWTFADPVAPPVASRRQGERLTLAEVTAWVLDGERPGVPVLVEGVGGLLCPLTEDETVADLAASLKLPLVVVARLSLGTLNHTLLTVEVARARGLPVAGVVVNAVESPSTLAEETNVAELERRLTVPVLAVVPHQAAGVEPPAELAAVDWWRLCSVGPG
jgi:dethiobiotin synthetase